MAKILIAVIVVSAIANMVADVFLVSGKDYSIKNPDPIDTIKRTPDKHIILSGMIGVFALAMWFSVVYFLSYIDGNIGVIISLSYAMFIGSIMVFHVTCSYIFLLAKHSKLETTKLKKLLSFYMIPCILFSTVYTACMVYLGMTGVLKMNFLSYITLPLFSTAIVQMGLGKLIKYKHFDSIAGTLSMLVSMLFTINIIASNFNVFI